MKLSRTVGYALQASVHLAAARTQDPVSCRRLAEAEGLPERFLLQILRSLVTHGILRSTRGVEGGYALSRPAAEIQLLNIIEAIDGPVQLELPETAQVTPALRGALEHVTQRFRQELGSVTLEDLVNSHAA